MVRRRGRRTKETALICEICGNRSCRACSPDCTIIRAGFFCIRFRYLLDTTRKYALPLLDDFDRIDLTRRAGNTRYLKSKG